MDEKITGAGPQGNNGGLPHHDGGSAFLIFAQAAACESSTALGMSATLRHIAEAVVAAGGTAADVRTALDSKYRSLVLALDGALADVVGDYPAPGEQV